MKGDIKTPKDVQLKSTSTSMGEKTTSVRSGKAAGDNGCLTYNVRWIMPKSTGVKK